MVKKTGICVITISLLDFQSMMNFSYKDDFSALDIHPRIVEGARRANLRSLVQVLTLSTNDLLHITRLSVKDVNRLQYCAADALVVFSPITALQICHGECPNNLKKCFLSSGCNIIDNFLKEGIVSGLLTEISGESAAGKSQLCLQMCLMVQLSKQWGGLDGRAVYICTEDVFPIARLNSMVTRLKGKFQDFRHICFTDNIFIEHAADFSDLQSCLAYKVPFLISEKKVRLVIVDSIAAIMRNEKLEKGSFKERYKKLSFVSSKLKEISFAHNIPVILVNQVVDNFSTSCMQDNIGKKMPCLGPAWADMMNIRLSLSRTSDFMNINLSDDSTGAYKSVKANIRYMEILSAPHLPNISCRFVVDEDGVKGLDHKINKT